MYVTYICNKCNISFMIPKADLERMATSGRHIACNYGHRDIRMIDRYKVSETDMTHDSYSRVRGKVVQRGWGQ